MLNEEAEKLLELSVGKRPFDVFLSHKWDGDDHHPLATYVRLRAISLRAISLLQRKPSLHLH